MQLWSQALAWQNSPGLAHRQGVIRVAGERVSGPEMGSNFGQGWRGAPSPMEDWAVLGRSAPYYQSPLAKPQAEAWRLY